MYRLFRVFLLNLAVVTGILGFVLGSIWFGRHVHPILGTAVLVVLVALIFTFADKWVDYLLP